MSDTPQQPTTETTEQPSYIRRIRSFVLREGRLTKAQKLALEQHWPSMGLDYQPQQLDVAALFQREAPTVLEIGFGMGKSLVQMAQAAPEKNFIGIEVHRPGVGACLADAASAGISNLKVIQHDAIDVLNEMLPDQSLSTVQLFFPDPWPKKKHHKRRIVQTDFVQLLRKKLAIGGVFHMATDWQNYAEHMLEVMQSAEGFSNVSAEQDYVERPAHRPETKFELRGKKLGHGVWDLMFKREH
ncbi:tRNA (guanosine(46)-N7)-methyltransferase TrmB [Alkalimonas collagenimarina]|uniref:tRNA (guanine-N(7)-)-methyltransferase n=1 Tax=Alkalimonas collagenimarina TaxID=400390 RepID=A0ABT9GV14_9GAMM|nr:tRNA (guanosine(46)-N7)-methyltransferase TrmB [Alkalimonas collagenimarina]MDP4534889.1 tRNA (guanosine(46)-N7)-methyltransferase TrmB [Alkalimonas collagenimarina]